MHDHTNWTPSPDENKLHLTDKNLINEIEAKGIAAAELFVFGLDSDTPLSTKLICEIHRIAFSDLYDWAGKWRQTSVLVGQLIPPEPDRIINLMYQYIDNLNFKLEN